MPGSASLSDAREFAASVAGVVSRHGGSAAAGWAPGEVGVAPDPALGAALEELGWDSVAEDPSLVVCAGLGAMELGRCLTSLWHVDRLLGGGPAVNDLVRSVGPSTPAVVGCDGARRALLRSERRPSAAGLDVHQVLELGPAGDHVTAVAWDAWLTAGVGYLAGLGEGALALTVDYARQRVAFGSTLAALAPVQQLLAGAATAVRGVALLAGCGAVDGDALAHAGTAIAEACAACQQVSGAIGFTLEYPLHRFTQRARALQAWNEALLDGAAVSEPA
jgi:butyryl-CoA dehydrogenase